VLTAHLGSADIFIVIDVQVSGHCARPAMHLTRSCGFIVIAFECPRLAVRSQLAPSSFRTVKLGTSVGERCTVVNSVCVVLASPLHLAHPGVGVVGVDKRFVNVVIAHAAGVGQYLPAELSGPVRRLIIIDGTVQWDAAMPCKSRASLMLGIIDFAVGHGLATRIPTRSVARELISPVILALRPLAELRLSSVGVVEGVSSVPRKSSHSVRWVIVIRWCRA
jgi:hypothetical protein